MFVPSCRSQNTFLVSLAPELLFTGPWGNGGKSVGLVTKPYLIGKYYPGAPMFLARKVKADLNGSTIEALRKIVPPEEWETGLVGGSNPESFNFSNGSRIDFLGFDRKEKFLSTEYAWGGVDEANELSEDDWEFAAYRLRDRSTPILQMAGSTNPDSPAHFLYAKFQPDAGSHQIFADPADCPACEATGNVLAWFIDDETGRMWEESVRCEKCEGSGKWRELVAEVVVAGPEENDQNLPVEYVRRKKRATGIRKLRYVDGKWVAFSGLVFDTFDPNVHVINRPAAWARWGGWPDPGWPRYRAIDFGFVDAFVCQWWTRAGSGAWIMYREIYHTGRTVRAHAARMKILEQREREEIAAAFLAREEAKYASDPWEWARVKVGLEVPKPRFMATYCDHDAEDRATLLECGFANVPARKERKPGIETIQDLLAIEEVDGERRARLYFLRDADALDELDWTLQDAKKATRTIEEFGRYLWIPKAEGKAAKEDTVPDNDHGMDAMRYMHHSFRLGVTGLSREFDAGSTD